MRRRVSVLAVALLVLLTGCRETSVDGPTLYTRNCAACHGSDLSGSVGPAIGPGSPSVTATDDELRTVIVVGAEGMPGSNLNPEQLEALVAYIRDRQAE